MKILITHTYFRNLDPKEAAGHKPYPPLAPLYLAALIKQEIGLDVQFYDVTFDADEQSLIDAIDQLKPDMVLFYDDDFNYLTKMCLQNMRQAVFNSLQQAQVNCLFIAHSSDASDQDELYLKAGFKYVVHRNAEIIILQIISLLMENQPEKISEMASVSFLKDGHVHKNPLAKENISLEHAPLPLWEKIDLTPYRNMWINYHGYFSLNVSTAHGCPFHCNWCAKPLYGRTYKALPAARIASEFSLLKHSLKVDHVWITDDIFGLKPGWISEFADELEKRNAHIPYKIQLRADLVTQTLTTELARSGCDEVWLGVESGSQKILDAMEKELTVEQTLSALALLRSYEMKVGFFLQYGYPGEELEDIKMTLAMIRRCKPDFIGISVTYPLKDTPFYNSVISRMGDKKNWQDSGDLALMFPGKYHPDFYRALHKFTHHYFGFYSIFKPQPLNKRIRRFMAQYKHIPGLIRYRLKMNTYLNLV